MPLSLSSCLCSSNLSINSLVDVSYTPTLSTQSIRSSDGFVTSSTKVCASEIKPRKSNLHPKLRMSTKEYNEYKQFMDSLGLWEKKVHFGDDVLSNNQNASIGQTGLQKSPESPTNALYDDDTDYVAFEEYEPFRLERLKPQVSTTSYESNAISANERPERSALTVEQVISTDYDFPRKQAISTDYDLPRKQVISTNYDLPRKKSNG